MNARTFTFCIILVINGLSVFGQADMQFKYRYSDEFRQPVFSQVFLTFPNGNTKILYSDTAKTSEFIRFYYFYDTGKYTLKVIFESSEYGKDSIDYPFELNGEETDIEIDVRFSYGINNLVSKQKEKEKKPTGYVYVTKYYSPSNNISIHLSDIESSEIWGDTLHGFHFILTNNSKDTLYGKYFNHFWGTISIMNSDSTWGRKNPGNIDLNVNIPPPLYPDSTAFATVGTWGYFSKNLKNKYQYELHYSVNKWNTGANLKRIEKKSFLWYTSTIKYHKLVYEFEIK